MREDLLIAARACEHRAVYKALRLAPLCPHPESLQGPQSQESHQSSCPCVSRRGKNDSSTLDVQEKTGEGHGQCLEKSTERKPNKSI